MNEKSLSTDGSGTLVLILHAYRHGSENVEQLRQAVQKHWRHALCICPELPLTMWSAADMDDIIADLIQRVDKEVSAAESGSTPITSIILVGHSVGALIARKLYVVGCGETEDAPFSERIKDTGNLSPVGMLLPRKWAVDVSRVILLAGMNRGWRISHHLDLKKLPLWTAGAAIARLAELLTRKNMVILSTRRGSSFVTELRIQWIRMRQMHRRLGDDSPGGATTIQLLGSIDDLVAPQDNVDLVSGGDFIYLDVPFSGHANIIDVDEPLYGDERKRLFLLSLSGSPEELETEAVVPSDEQFASPNEKVQRMVFVIHGIRDAGYWTHKIARRVLQRTSDSLDTWATETSSYGYFPMLPFVLPWYRRTRVEWLMDQYTEALARYPNASVSYVGHSNGTYLLAKALESYPCCRFENVVFAGSVVKTTYDWSRFMTGTKPRVNAVLNFMATRDGVVAFFPRLFELIQIQDLGSAGHDGFSNLKSTRNINQVGYVIGGHSAAIQEPVWDMIADFVINGQTDNRLLDSQQIKNQRNSLIKAVGTFPPFVWAFIGLIVIALWKGIDCLLHVIIGDPLLASSASGFALATYLLVLWLVVTRL